MVHDRQVVIEGRPPDRVERGVVDRYRVGDERHHRDRPARFAPFADLVHRRVDIASRGHDHAFQPVGVLARKIRQMPVIGTDHADFERRVVMADEAGPGGRDQEMPVGALIVHVADPALGRIVLHPGARLLAAHPVGIAAAMGLARRRLAENALIGDLAIAVDVAAGRAAGRPGADRHPVRRQLVETRAKARIDVFVEHLGGRLDMGVGIKYAQPVLHHAPPSMAYCVLYTPRRGCAETPPAALRKMLDRKRQIA